MQDFHNATLDRDKKVAKDALALRDYHGHEAALEYLDGVLKFKDQSAILWHAKGRIHKDAHEDKESVKAFAKAFTLDPDDLFIMMSYGGMLTKTYQYDAAEKVYLSFFERQQNDARYLTALGHVYQCTRNYDFAAACFGKAKQLAPYDRFAFKRITEIEKLYQTTYSYKSWKELQEHALSFEQSKHQAHPPFALQQLTV